MPVIFSAVVLFLIISGFPVLKEIILQAETTQMMQLEKEIKIVQALLQPDEEKTIPVDREHFPDEIFCVYICEFVDVNRDGMLSKVEIERITCMDMSGKANFKGTKKISFKIVPKKVAFLKKGKLCQLPLY